MVLQAQPAIVGRLGRAQFRDLPLVLGDDATTMRVAGAVQAAGYDVRGIRPPTVPAGEARLRISITLNTSEAEIDGLARAIMAALA